MVAVRHFPPIDESMTRVDGPCREVTLLEDRAQVRRVAELRVSAGVTHIAIEDVAPTLQDVSLTAVVLDGRGRVTDVRCRRAMRVWKEDERADLEALEAEIQALRRGLRHLSEDRTRLDARHTTLMDIVQQGADEIPVDASWGLVDQQAWRETFEGVFERVSEVRQQIYDLYHQQLDLKEQLDNALARRVTATQSQSRLVAWIEADIAADADEALTIAIDYVVPNALWRPMHRARLVNGHVHFEMSAVVWQRSGERWSDVKLSFSTARSSLGTEPPLLSDDRLQTQRRSEQVEVEARQVKIQRAKVPPGEATSTARALPGVDDGGEIRLLVAKGAHDVPSDGRPTTVPLDAFEAPCEARLVVMPELEPRAFCETLLSNHSAHPILAGPVALVRDHGFVGWTETMFVAPNERFSLSFGPDDAVRVTRTAREATETDHVDGWRVTAHLVKLFLSNLGGDPKRLVVTERIAVSEVEQVRVTLLDEETSNGPTVDDDGFVKWTVDLEPHGRETRQLAWSIAVAPGVEGL